MMVILLESLALVALALAAVRFYGKYLRTSTELLQEQRLNCELKETLERNSAAQERLLSDLRESNGRLDLIRTEQRARIQCLEEKVAFIDRAKAELEKAFRAMAGDLSLRAIAELRNQNTSQSRREKEVMLTLLQPLQKSVETLREQFLSTDRRHSESAGRLDEQYRQLTQAYQNLSRETHQLNAALRNPNVRGRWGEMQLRRLVELAGMREHVDFSVQVATVDETRLLADMVIHLPNGQNIIVDAKTVFDSYLASLRCDSDEERDRLLRLHSQQIGERIRDLSQRNYWKHFDRAFDFVILFLPADSFYVAALEQKPDLAEMALEKHVLLATPMILIGLLKTAAFGWTQIQSTAEAEQIRLLANELFDRLGVVFERLGKMGNHLRQTVQDFNESIASIDTRLRPTLRRFGEMKSLQTKNLSAPVPIDDRPRELRGQDRP